MQRNADYGYLESNPINDAVKAHREAADEIVELDDPRLARIVRLRLVSDPGFPLWDLSYCYGTLKDGTHARVQIDELHISRRAPKKDLIAIAKREGVFAKGLGLLDENNWSILR